MSVAGIDVSTKAIDIVLLDDDSNHGDWKHIPLQRIPKDEHPAWTSSRSVRLAFPGRAWWENHGVWLIGMEDPRSDGITPAKALGMVTGAILALLPSNLTVIPMPPHEWKLWSIGGGHPGAGNAKKHDVALWAGAQGVGPNPADFNATDAYAIARAARALNDDAQQPAA